MYKRMEVKYQQDINVSEGKGVNAIQEILYEKILNEKETKWLLVRKVIIIRGVIRGGGKRRYYHR